MFFVKVKAKDGSVFTEGAYLKEEDAIAAVKRTINDLFTQKAWYFYRPILERSR